MPFVTTKQAKQIADSLTVATAILNAIKKYGYKCPDDGVIHFKINKFAKEYVIFESVLKEVGVN